MKWISIAIASIFAMGLVACGTDALPRAENTPPADETWTEDEWTVVTPAGWTSEDITTSADAEKAIRYRAADGRYFIIAIDPLGSDFTYDAIWRYRVNGRGFEVASKRACTSATDESCQDDDDRYDGYVLWKNGSAPQKVGGHIWYFMFGHDRSTSIDTATFEQILESVRAA